MRKLYSAMDLTSYVRGEVFRETRHIRGGYVWHLRTQVFEHVHDRAARVSTAMLRGIVGDANA